MRSSERSKDIEASLLSRGRQSSFTYTRTVDLAATQALHSDTIFGILERLFPQRIGLYYLLCSILFMSLNAYFTQLADELPIPEIIFLRSLFMLIGLIIFLSKYNSDLDIGDKRYKSVVIILCVLAIPTSLSYVYGVVSLQLVDAMTIMISSPIFVSIFSWFIFAQHFKKEQLISIVVWFIGITLIMGHSLSGTSDTTETTTPITSTNTTEVAPTETTTTTSGGSFIFKGDVACLINALLTATSTTVIKATNVKIPPIMLMTYGTLFSLVFSGVLCLIFGFVMPELWTWINMIVIGFLFFYGQFFLMKSLEHTNAGVNVALISNTQIVLIYILQLALVQVVPSFWSFVGTILVVAACIILASVSR